MNNKVYFQFNIFLTFKYNVSYKQRNSLDTGTSIIYMIDSHMGRGIIKCESSKSSQPMKAWV